MNHTVKLSDSGLRGLMRQIEGYQIEEITFGGDKNTLILHFEDDIKVTIEADEIKEIKYSY